MISNIPYVTRKRQEVNLKVYDVWGREVFSKTETSQAGRNIIKFSTTLLSTGLYYYNLSDGKTVLTRKMTVIRF
ncbi:MAG: T9SS type A sorting domain-containing protein [Bacteroidetes bacterium]|nr:T9SS type A sorting domain-containing protein [Bacteroidota bacterium]